MNNGASLLYLPEVSQTDLNRLVRAMFVIGTIGSDEWRGRAGKLWKFLLGRRQPVIDAIGTDDPVVLANALASATQDDFNDRWTRLGSIRLLVKPKSPMLVLPNGGTVIDYWISGVFNKIPEESWMMLAEQVFDGAN